MNLEEVEHQIQDLLEGRCEGKDLQNLVQELREKPEARRLYQAHVRINAILTMWVEDAGQPGSVLPTDLMVSRQRKKTVRMSAFAAAAVLIITGIVLTLIMEPPPPLATFKVSPKTEFVLTHAPPEGKEPPEGMRLEAGSHLLVEKGAVEVEFDSGVRGLIRGPADLRIREEGVVDLRKGSAWFEVSEKGVGFQVYTPDFLLTDLGTEFGVVSRPEQMDEFHVFTGKVEVRHRRGREVSKTVEEGEAWLATREGDWESIPQAPEAFLDELPTWAPAPPYLYWSFDKVEGDRFPVAGTHPDAGSLLSERGFAEEGPKPERGKVGKALFFDARRDYIKTDWPGIAGRSPCSVALWVKIPRLLGQDYNSSIVSWGTPGPAKGKVWSLRLSNRDSVVREQDLGKTVLQLWFSGAWINGTTDLADGRWHHVAICDSGELDDQGNPAVDLYVDGKREKIYGGGAGDDGSFPFPIATDLDSDTAIPLLIGRSKTREDVSCFATLDELYVFDGYVSESVITMLAKPVKGRLP